MYMRKQNIVTSVSDCMAVRLFTSIGLSLESHVQAKFSVHVHMAVARFSSGGVAICYVRPVLWIRSCLDIMARNRRRDKAYTALKVTQQGSDT